MTRQNMQELLDHAREGSSHTGYTENNPWKWDYENEVWSAIDDEGCIWLSEGEDGDAFLAGTP